jgi:hypothetical protein
MGQRDHLAVTDGMTHQHQHQHQHQHHRPRASNGPTVSIRATTLMNKTADAVAQTESRKTTKTDGDDPVSSFLPVPILFSFSLAVRNSFMYLVKGDVGGHIVSKLAVPSYFSSFFVFLFFCGISPVLFFFVRKIV